tara:strand:+ start:324 stop:503 length:180 start_codon:yes stop_codon:yes gene_type:complete
MANRPALGIAVESPQRVPIAIGESEDLERKARPDLRRVTPEKNKISSKQSTCAELVSVS